MDKHCRICHNISCSNHGKNISFLGDGWKCNYINVPTNADRIRAMSDEELVVFLDGFSGRCLDCAEDAKNKSCQIYKDGHYCRPQDIMGWLQQPVEEDYYA